MAQWTEAYHWIRRQLGRLRARDGEGFNAQDGVALAVSVVISVLFWFTLKMQEQYTIAMDLPTEVVNVPEGESLTERPPEQVRVQVQGEGWQLLQIYYRRQPISLNVANDPITVQEAAQLSAGSGISVTGANPPTVELDTGPRITRRVPVRPRARIEPAQTYEVVGSLTVEPDSVLVSGADSLVSVIDRWPTERVEREGVREDLDIRVGLADTLEGLVSVDTDRVRVRADVELFTEAVREVPVRVTDRPPGAREVRLEPSTVNVIFRVPMSQYERAVEIEGFSASVSYSTILRDTTGTVEPDVQTPNSITVRGVRVEPDRLRYFTVITSG